MLQIFYISRNHFEGEIPKEIGNLTLLTAFDCAINNFTGTIPYQISNLKNLVFLNLEVNNITGSIPPQIFNISTLRDFSLASNRLSGHLPSNMGLWLPNLEGLYLGENQLIGPLPISISNASKLTVFEMSRNYFSGLVPDTLGNLRNLKVLNLGGNNLTSSGMSFLSSLINCKSLEWLLFNDNPLISGELPGLIGNLSNSLQRFYAFGCDIRGSIPSGIGNLSHLIIMGLANNELTGSIPASMGGLQELQGLYLEENKLEGSIPSELCHLNNLAYLNLTSNKLSGPIPACLGNLISLRSLFLSSNMFSSSIPSTLTGLNDLLFLDLSSNSLSGALPIDIRKWKDSLIQTMTMATIGYMGPEYGIDGIVSTKGDVYSFGILMMETITGEKPTSEMFEGERSLKSWVEESISSPLNQVVDTNLLSTIGRERLAASNCALSILRLGLECSAESPAERPDMKEVVAKLKKIKVELLRAEQCV
ncbi:hypothetical protein V6N13_049878 [Hibiscus sabdariffa]